MSNTDILCSISTRGRYDTTLPLAIESVIAQTLKPDKLVIFDDNEDPKDLREIERYRYLFRILDEKSIEWEVVFGEKKGQHFNHQKANLMGYRFVWRLDDDNIAEPNVLHTLYMAMMQIPDVGAVGGSILVPGVRVDTSTATGKIDLVEREPSPQWGRIESTREVDHLHCSFLYRAGIVDYDLTLSRVAHREETLFTYELKRSGLKIVITPCITWHLQNSVGGIRDGDKFLYEHDNWIFNTKKDHTIVVLDSGLGDHICFKRVLPEIQNPLIYSCYPEVIPGHSINEAIRMIGDISPYNIYGKMDEWNWKGSLEDAFRKLYVRRKL